MGKMTVGEKRVLDVFNRFSRRTDSKAAAILTLAATLMWKNFVLQEQEWEDDDRPPD